MKYTVFVGGDEVVDYYVNKEKAERIKEMWEENGYDDVAIVEIDDNEIENN